MDPQLQQRIDAMLRRDIIAGVMFAAVMWLSLLFVFLVTARAVDDGLVVAVLAGSAVVLGVFNTLSLMSMISRYRHERHHVYGEDIAHLDAVKAAQAARRAGVAR